MEQAAGAHQLLLELHTALLASSALICSQQAALRTAVLHLLGQQQLHAAAALVLGAAGSCARQCDQLKRQLASLINERQLLDRLACLLLPPPSTSGNGTSSSGSSSSSEYAASILRGLRALASQPCTSVAVLQTWWSHPPNQCALLWAACDGPQAAAAVARLAVAAAAERGLAAAALLQPLSCSRASQQHGTAARPLPQASVWTRTALQPLLDQVMQALQQQQHAAAAEHADGAAPAAAAAAAAAVPPPLSAGQQQLWLLLCGCVEVAHRVGADLQIGSTPVFAASLRAALLAPQPPAHWTATMDLVRRAAIISPNSLALACFGELAPLMPGMVQQLVQQQQVEEQQPSTDKDGGGDEASDGVCAQQKLRKLLHVWHSLLDRMRSSEGSSLRQAFVMAQLPAVVAALAAGDDGDTTDIARDQQKGLVVVFLAAAGSISSHVQPLLRHNARHQRTLLAAVRPQAAALLQLVLRLSAPAAQPSSSSSSSSNVNASAVLVAVWLLHSSFGGDGSAAPLEPRHHQPCAAANSSSSSSSRHQDTAAEAQAAAPEAAAPEAAAPEAAAAAQACGEGCLVRLLHVVAGWLLQYGEPCGMGATAIRRVQVQAAGLTLLHNIVANPAQAVQLLGCSCATASSSNSISNPAAAAAWQQVWLALGDCLSQGIACPASLLKRQVLQALCKLLQAIAFHLPQLLLLGSPPPQSGASLPDGAEQHPAAAGSTDPWEQHSDLSPLLPGLRISTAPKAQAALLHHLHQLQQLRENLLPRNLDRSCSGEELLDAVEQAVHMLQFVIGLERQVE